MVRLLRTAAFTFLFLAASPALAEEPTAEQIEEAGQEFNKGRKAFKDGDFNVAAEHFERADALAPNSQVLLNAIVARMQADELPRAATLAALGALLYPDDEELSVVVDEVTARARKELLDVSVECASPCTLLVESRLIHGAPTTERHLFLPPGKHTLRAQFSGGQSAKKEVSGEAGESVTESFDAPEASDDRPFAIDSSSRASDDGADDDAMAAPDDSGDSTFYADPPKRDAPEDEAGGGISPVVFWVGVGATAVLGGVSIWSGVDTLQNPGTMRVQAACAGMGPTCPLYQQGKASELRTNVLWASTGVVAIATAIIGIAATDWGSSEDAAEVSASARRTRAGITPWFDVGADGAALGATGRF